MFGSFSKRNNPLLHVSTLTAGEQSFVLFFPEVKVSEVKQSWECCCTWAGGRAAPGCLQLSGPTWRSARTGRQRWPRSRRRSWCWRRWTRLPEPRTEEWRSWSLPTPRGRRTAPRTSRTRTGRPAASWGWSSGPTTGWRWGWPERSPAATGSRRRTPAPAGRAAPPSRCPGPWCRVRFSWCAPPGASPHLQARRASWSGPGGSTQTSGHALNSFLSSTASCSASSSTSYSCWSSSSSFFSFLCGCSNTRNQKQKRVSCRGLNSWEAILGSNALCCATPAKLWRVCQIRIEVKLLFYITLGTQTVIWHCSKRTFNLGTARYCSHCAGLLQNNCRLIRK